MIPIAAFARLPAPELSAAVGTGARFPVVRVGPARDAKTSTQSADQLGTRPQPAADCPGASAGAAAVDDRGGQRADALLRTAPATQEEAPLHGDDHEVLAA